MGFDETAWYVLPACTCIKSEGFDDAELSWYASFLKNNAPLIMEFAWEGGHVYA